MPPHEHARRRRGVRRSARDVRRPDPAGSLPPWPWPHARHHVRLRGGARALGHRGRGAEAAEPGRAGACAGARAPRPELRAGRRAGLGRRASARRRTTASARDQPAPAPTRHRPARGGLPPSAASEGHRVGLANSPAINAAPTVPATIDEAHPRKPHRWLVLRCPCRPPRARSGSVARTGVRSTTGSSRSIRFRQWD